MKLVFRWCKVAHRQDGMAAVISSLRQRKQCDGFWLKKPAASKVRNMGANGNADLDAASVVSEDRSEALLALDEALTPWQDRRPEKAQSEASVFRMSDESRSGPSPESVGRNC